MDQLGLFMRSLYETEREAARYRPVHQLPPRRRRFAMLRRCQPDVERPTTPAMR